MDKMDGQPTAEVLKFAKEHGSHHLGHPRDRPTCSTS